MELKDILNEETILMDLKANSKEDALLELAEKLLEKDYILNVEDFLVDIYAREEKGQTGLGNYIAIPHGISEAVREIGVAIGVSKNEIPWETLDGNGVKIIILFAVGPQKEGENNHLKLLSLFARKLGNDEVIEKLLNASTSSEVKDAFIK